MAPPHTMGAKATLDPRPSTKKRLIHKNNNLLRVSQSELATLTTVAVAAHTMDTTASLIFRPSTKIRLIYKESRFHFFSPVGITASSAGVSISDHRSMPDEIWINILRRCATEGLRHTSLVSKQLHRISAEFLYSSFDGIVSAPKKGKDKSEVAHGRVATFLKTILDKPHLAAHIRKLRFSNPDNSRDLRILLPGVSAVVNDRMINLVGLGNVFRVPDKNGEINLWIEYTIAVYFLIRLSLHKDFKVTLLGVDRWAFGTRCNHGLHSNLSLLIKDWIKPLNHLTVAPQSNRDHYINQNLVEMMKHTSLKSFTGMGKSFRLPDGFVFPQLELQTVELQECVAVTRFLQSIRCLEVLKWRGGAFSNESPFYGFLNLMNYSRNNFKHNLKELVIDKIARHDDVIIALNLSAFSNLRRITIPYTLAFGRTLDDEPQIFDAFGRTSNDQSESVDSVWNTINKFMANMPTCLQYLALTNCWKIILEDLAELMRHKERSHIHLQDIYLAFHESVILLGERRYPIDYEKEMIRLRPRLRIGWWRVLENETFENWTPYEGRHAKLLDV